MRLLTGIGSLVAVCAVGALALAIFRVHDAQLGASLGQSAAAAAGRPPVKPTSTIAAAVIAQRETNTDWATAYSEGGNYFDFVSKAAQNALDGDGKAARYISKALYVCVPIVKMYSNSANPEADFNARWATRTKAPQWVVDKARKDFHSCVGFIKGDAFVGLPERAGGYNSSLFWIDQASQEGDPVAKSLDAGLEVANTTFEQSSEVKSKSLAAAQLAINDAVAAQDLSALFQVGRVLSDGHASSDPVQGFAVSIAACNLGYDCTAGNKELFAECVGQCPSAINYSDLIKEAIGEDGYAKAYIRAQALEDAISRKDSTEIQKFVQLQPTS